HNPVWPDLRVDVPALGIDWPGNYPFGEVRAASVKGSAVAKNVPLKQLLQELFTQPGTIKDDEQRYIHTYGLGVPWVLLPAALFVAGRLALAMLRGGDGRSRARLFEVVGLLATAIVTLVASTNRSTPRYHVMTLALWAPLVAWAFARYRALQSALVLAATVGSLAILAWEMPGWRSFPSPSQLVELARLDPPLREITPELGAPVVRAAGVARDRELGPGAVVVSNDFVFPAVLWNDDYSNRVVFVRASEDLVAAAEHLGATWIYASDKPSAARVRENPRWSEIGPLYAEGWGTAFRRRQD
ncbi:MAG TPA: hypothetical protein VE987_06120, partial [Polyangiaceae bacterium]|nr:hypothetical protein [Polyangiaceae bacterium]